MIDLTIVTVNFNSGKGLELTINALEGFVCDPRVELVLIDACSDDQSKVFIESNGKKFDILVIEPDKGIYDAMNKGIRKASGKWIWFVNSGDLALAKCNSLLDFLALNEGQSKVIYSDLALSNGCIIKQKSNKLFFIRRMMNHQNVIYSNDLLRDEYNLDYRYCADFAHMVRRLNDISFIRCNEQLCMYDINGFSSNKDFQVRQRVWLERYRALRCSDSFVLNYFGSSFAFIVFIFFRFLTLVKGR